MKAKRLYDLYVIAVDFYHYDIKQQVEYTKIEYLGLQNYKGHNIFVFDDEIIPRTLVFKDVQEAIDYIDENKLWSGSAYENIKVRQIKNCF